MAQGGEITSIKFYIYELCSFYGCGLGERIPERTRYNDEAKIFEPVLATPFRDRNLLLADVVSWVSKPCRCLFHITPVIPNRHFIPSSLLFFIHNSQLALISGCFQAQSPPNGHRTPRLGSNNGSGDIRDGMVAKRNLAALGPLLLSGRC